MIPSSPTSERFQENGQHLSVDNKLIFIIIRSYSIGQRQRIHIHTVLLFLFKVALIYIHIFNSCIKAFIHYVYMQYVSHYYSFHMTKERNRIQMRL